jgi:signal peptidase I
MAPTIVGFHSDVTCPNCGITFAVRRGEAGKNNQSSRLDCWCPNCGTSFDVSDVIAVRSGDRILADKMSKPCRGELVIYWVAARPEINAPPTNYVKRLVGLPGEKLTVLDGDVFINGERLVNRPDELMDLWFPLHDSRFVPKEIAAATARWKAQEGKGWSLDGASWKFDGGPAATGELEFDGKLTDRMAYNVESPDFRLPPQAEHPVGDIRIDCKRRLSGQGKWSISWDFDGQTVLCDFSTDGDIDLACKSTEELPGMAGVPTTRHGKLAEANEEASTVSLAVRDGHAYVMEGDYNHVRASLQIAPDKLSDVHTQSESKPGRLTIHAEGDCKLELERIQIFRDVYYTQPHNRAGDGPYSIELGRDEWFVLGDNSATSADSRYTGPFKTDAFVGIARFRYWPPSRWHSFQ